MRRGYLPAIYLFRRLLVAAAYVRTTSVRVGEEKEAVYARMMDDAVWQNGEGGANIERTRKISKLLLFYGSTLFF